MILKDESKGLQVSGSASARIVNADGSQMEGKSKIVKEHHMELYLQGMLTARLVCTPTNLPDLIVGRLLTEGFIDSIKDVKSLEISQDGQKAWVLLNKELELTETIAQELTSTANNEILKKAETSRPLAPLAKAPWTNEAIFALAQEFANGSLIHKATKGAHCCYLSYEGKPIYAAEDIGRHNALDKAIGYLTGQELDKNRCILFTTGRVPTDMCRKLVAAGLPILVSKAVPTDRSIELAKKYNLTLICKAWPDRFEVFNEGK